jgi:hypothetical protein
MDVVSYSDSFLYHIRVPPSFEDILEPEVSGLVSSHDLGFSGHRVGCGGAQAFISSLPTPSLPRLRTIAPERPTTVTRPSPDRMRPASRL